MKTYKQWEESEKDFHDFIEPMDEIDEELYLYYGEVVAPKYCANGLIQCGEAWKRQRHVYWYETFNKVNDKYYYIGVLPEFKQ